MNPVVQSVLFLQSNLPSVFYNFENIFKYKNHKLHIITGQKMFKTRRKAKGTN